MSGDFRKYAAAAFRQMEEGPAHPAMEEIAAYVRGRLRDSQPTNIESHLVKCAACRERASEFRLLLAILRQNGNPTHAPGESKRVS